MKLSGAVPLFAVGFLSMLGQVVLLRELAVFAFGVELIYLLGLGFWLAAGAAGAVAGRGAPRPGGTGGGTPFLWLAAAIPLEIAFLRTARLLAGGVPGAYLPLGQQALAAAVGVMPAGALLGAIFRRAAARLIEGGGTLAAAYAWESAGGALGSAAATLSLAAGISNMALGACAGVASVVAAGGPGRRGRLAMLAPLLLLAAASAPVDRWLTGLSHPGLAATSDTPYGRVAATRASGQLAVFVNDALAFESEGTDAEEFVHVAALHAPSVARVLVLEGGAAGILPELLKHGPARVDDVEGDRAMHEAVAPLLTGAPRDALGHDSVRVIFADPRRFLARAPVYDLILVAAPEPGSAQANRFYTAEFFRSCSARLSSGGVLAVRLPSSENFWTPALVRRNGSVYAALRSAFPDVRVVPGAADLFLASAARLPRDPETLSARFAARGIAARLVGPEHIRYLLTNDRVAAIERRLSEAAAPPNSDARPVCYRQTALLWLGRFLPTAATDASPGTSGWPWLLAAAAAMVLARFRLPVRRALLAAVAGFGGMAAEGVVLLRFQGESGSLYRDIGLLLTSFMAGLAAGAVAVDRAAAGGRPLRRPLGAALLVCFALLNLLLAAASRGGLALFGAVASAIWLFLAGFLVAAVFGYASRFRVEDPGKTVAPLYAADLLGGCLGSLLAGIVLVPLHGVAATAAGTAALALAALLLV